MDTKEIRGKEVKRKQRGEEERGEISIFKKSLKS